MSGPQLRPGESVDQPNAAHLRRGWLAVFVAALALYTATANRGAQWQDSGRYILRALTGEWVDSRGLALSHPLHHGLSRSIVFFDLVEPCFAVTLLSAVAAAVAVANTYGCVLTLTRSRPASLLAAGSLGLAHTFWQMATLAETYTLSAALLSAECWCLATYALTCRRNYLWAMLLFNGLGVANHLLGLLTTPVLAFVVLHAVWTRRIRVKDAAVGLAMWLLGSLPYSGLVVAELFRTGDVSGTLHSALFGNSFAEQVLNTRVSVRMLLIGAGFIVLNFPNLLLPAAVYGLARAGRFGIPVLVRRALPAGLLIHVCFVARYDIVDQHTFFLPMYVLLSIFGGIGFAAMLRRFHPRARHIGWVVATSVLTLTPVVYAAVPQVARRFDILRSVARNKPYRDDYVYLFTPWSVVERSAERMSREAVALAGRDGLILVEDTMAVFAIRYQALRTGLDRVEITRDTTPERIASAVAAERTLVLVPLDSDKPRTKPPVGSWKRMGNLYVLDANPSMP